MCLLTISTMRIEKIQPSRHKAGRVLLFLEDGSLLKITEQELLDFGLCPGDVLEEETLERLRESAGSSRVKGQAAEMIGRRAMSRAELERKLREKGASENDAAYAAQWLEAIGAINDADYAAALVRHCAARGYGPGRTREKLREKGVPRELWDAALEELPGNEEQILRFLEGKLRGSQPEEKEKKRLTDALLRRGYPWGDIRAAWNRLGAETDGWDE